MKENRPSEEAWGRWLSFKWWELLGDEKVESKNFFDDDDDMLFVSFGEMAKQKLWRVTITEAITTLLSLFCPRG